MARRLAYYLPAFVDVEDLMQVARTALWQSLPTWDPEKAPLPRFVAYRAKMAMMTCIYRLRAQKRMAEDQDVSLDFQYPGGATFGELLVNPQMPLEDVVASKVDAEILFSSFSDFRQDQQDFLRLKWGGYPRNEAIEMTKLKTGTAWYFEKRIADLVRTGEKRSIRKDVIQNRKKRTAHG